MSERARGPRDYVPDLRSSDVCWLQAAIARAPASAAEAATDWVRARDTLSSDKKSSSPFVDSAAGVSASDMAHEARHRGEAMIIA